MYRVTVFGVLFLGSCLLLVGALFDASAYWCIFNKPTCCMVDPLFSAIALFIGAFVVAVGVLYLRRWHLLAAISYIPVLGSIVLLVGQAASWW